MLYTYGSILSVDGEAKDRQEIVSYLEDSGFTMYQAETGEEALKLFRQKKPDLVLSDLQLPSMGGFELLTKIKQESPETPVIVISKDSIMKDVIEALRSGAWDYIVKPVLNLAVVEHAVCKALERSRLLLENKNYRQQLEEKNQQLSSSLSQLKEDQQAGKSVQQQLLPQAISHFDNYTISHKIMPSLYLSGDFIDYFEINNEKIAFYIADVSGHGASSAFVTVLLNGLVEKILSNYKMGHNDVVLHPEAVLKQVSDDIYNAKLGKYLTMIYCVIDVKQNKLYYSIGGHFPYPIIWDGSQSRTLSGEGFAVGIIKDAHYKCYQCDLPLSFTMAMFSDGILEVMNGENVEDKENKLLKSINNLNINIDTILNSLNIKDDESLPDDITLLLVNKK